MSADCESTLMMDGKLHRIMSLIGDIEKMDNNYMDCDFKHVTGIRLYNWTDNNRMDFNTPIPDGEYRLVVDFHYPHVSYRFSLEVARVVIDKYPDIAETMYADYANDQWDDCGGFAFCTDDDYLRYWYVEPEDWNAYLDGDYKSTSQYKRWLESNGENNKDTI